MKKNPLNDANALALTGGALYIVCRLLVLVFPNESFKIVQLWFHGIVVSQNALQDAALLPFLYGLATFVIASWLIGYSYSVIRHLMK